MSEHSKEFEREVLDAVRELRGTVRAVKIVIGIAFALALLMAVAGLVNVFFRGGDNGGNPGNDVHIGLMQSAFLATTTEAGQDVSATISSMTWGQGPVLEVRVKGADPAKLPAEPWTFVLENGQVLALTTEGTLEKLTVKLEGSLPGGSKVRFVHFNPDDSRGDLYFDVQ